LPPLSFEGTVYSGKGTGKKFVALPWVQTQIEQKLGFTPYPGTLNIRLTEETKEKRKLLDPKKGLLVKPQTGYYAGVLFRASIECLECAVVVPLMPNYPGDVLEVISPLYLRGKLGLIDGKRVTVCVTVF
jgi:riboflavin kinase, archaea type